MFTIRPFGASIEPPKDDVGYTGHKFDTALGLSYMQQRYYDPELGIFYGNDPIGFRDIYSFNRFAYANNNPYKYTDPDGNSAALAACVAGPLGCAAGALVTTAAIYHGVKGTREALAGQGPVSHLNESTVKELDLLHDDDALGERPDLETLSDDELLDSVNNPNDVDDPGLVENSDGKLINGNSRARELKKRANNSSSKIESGTKVKITKEQSSNSDYFWDL